MAYSNRDNTVNPAKKLTKLLNDTNAVGSGIIVAVAGGGGSAYEEEIAEKPMNWASFYDRKECWGYPGEPIASPCTYANARTVTIAFLQGLKGDGLRFIVHTNRRGDGTEIVVADLETDAFPASEQMVDEYHGVTVCKDGTYLHTVYLFPLSSYLWGNTRDFWEKEEEDKHDPWDDYDDDRYSDDRGRYDDDEQWSCICDASGPYFCSCRRNNDD